MDQTIANFADNEEVVADAGYSSGERLQDCDNKNLDAWIPNFGQYKFQQACFVFNEEQNQYKCIQEGGSKAVLPFKGIRTNTFKR